MLWMSRILWQSLDVMYLLRPNIFRIDNKIGLSVVKCDCLLGPTKLRSSIWEGRGMIKSLIGKHLDLWLSGNFFKAGFIQVVVMLGFDISEIFIDLRIYIQNLKSLIVIVFAFDIGIVLGLI